MPCAVAIIVKSTDECQITIQQEMHASIVEYIKNSFKGKYLTFSYLSDFLQDDVDFYKLNTRKKTFKIWNFFNFCRGRTSKYKISSININTEDAAKKFMDPKIGVYINTKGDQVKMVYGFAPSVAEYALSDGATRLIVPCNNPTAIIYSK